MQRSESTQETKVNNQLPYIHHKIEPNDLKLDETDHKLKLYTQEQIQFLKTVLADQAKGRYSKKKIFDLIKNNSELLGIYKSLFPESPNSLPFGIIKITDNELYAIYKGTKKKSAAGAGGMGVVKLMQNLTTGEFGALKIISTKSSFLKKEAFEKNITNLTKEIESLQKKLNLYKKN